MKINNKNILKLRIIPVLIFLSLFSDSIFAQNEFLLGSPYTAFGIGDLQYNSNLRNESMGISGVGLFGKTANNLNPAANTKIPYTNISLGFRYTFLNSSSNSFSSKISNGNITGINIGIPFNKDLGWTLIAGFNPVSLINYKISNKVTSFNETYTQTYAGSGGLSRINLGMTYLLFKTISIGAEYNYSFGNLKKLTYLDFNSQTVYNSYIRKESDLSGSFFKGGIIIDIGKLINSKSVNDFTLGFCYQSKLKINNNLDAIYGTNTNLTLDTLEITGGSTEIPPLYGFGISKKIGKQLIISGDAVIQDWSKYKVSDESQENFGNSYRFGLGLEIIPLAKFDNTFWENITYRFGSFYNKNYYSVNGYDINEYGLSVGFGIPINNFNSFDLSIAYSIRGKVDNGLIKDQFLKISAGLNFGELWFIKSRGED